MAPGQKPLQTPNSESKRTPRFSHYLLSATLLGTSACGGTPACSHTNNPDAGQQDSAIISHDNPLTVDGSNIRCSISDQRIIRMLQNMTINRRDGTRTDGCEVVSNLLDVYNGFSGNATNEQRINSVLERYDFSQMDSATRQITIQKLLIMTNSLWVDQSGIVPWHLRDYSQAELDALFWVNLGTATPSGTEFPRPSLPLGQEYYGPDAYGSPQMQFDATFKLRRLASRFIQSNQGDTINALVSWQKQNFFHAYFDPALGENWGWSAYNHPLPDGSFAGPQTLDELFDFRITGCHDNAFLLAADAKSLNIPAIAFSVQGHGLTYFPTINRYVHGDHIADFVFVPAQRLLLPPADIIAIANGSCSDGVHCTIYDLITGQYPTYPPGYLIATTGSKHRNNTDELYLRVTEVSVSIPADQWATMQAEVPAFTLHYDPTTRLLFSDPVQIRSLSDLSR